MSEQFTLGVEEEYQIIDPVTRDLEQRVEHFFPAVQKRLGESVAHELFLSEIESDTPICRTLAEVRAQVRRMRRAVISEAEKAGSRIVSAGTHPFADWGEQTFSFGQRYQELARQYRQVASELIIFGCHVHIGISDPEARIQVLNRARVWLAPLLALSASSPFLGRNDTGYNSFRSEIWTRLPTTGSPQRFESYSEYEQLIREMVATGVIEDGTKIYWDIRPSIRYPTVEFRVADACQTIDETAMVAGLVRGLARTCYEQAQRDEPYPQARGELLRLGQWRAARDGLEGELFDVTTSELVPAPELVARFLAFVRPGLEASGDWAEVSALVEQTLNRGNGAARQRAAYRQSGSLEDVVDMLVAETAQGLVSE